MGKRFGSIQDRISQANFGGGFGPRAGFDRYRHGLDEPEQPIIPNMRLDVPKKSPFSFRFDH